MESLLSANFVTRTPVLSCGAASHSLLFLVFLVFVRSSGRRPLDRHGPTGRRPVGPCSRTQWPVQGPLKGALHRPLSPYLAAQRPLNGPLSLVSFSFSLGRPARRAGLGSGPKGPLTTD